MIAIARDDLPCKEQYASPEDHFLGMLPLIRSQAAGAFRTLRRELREELIQEVIASAYCAFARLVELGKQDIAYPTPLGRYAIRHVRSGRRVGSKLNVRDVTSRYAQLATGITQESLNQFDGENDAWLEVVVEDRRAGPAETAAARIDIAAWLGSLPCRVRRIAETLASGEKTQKVASLYGLSSGRISQLRRELQTSWKCFHGDAAVA